jgi:hypothetical protein
MASAEPTIGPLISLDELSRRTGISPPELRRLRDEEGMPCYRLGRRWWRVIPAEFRAWLNERAAAAKTSQSGSGGTFF